MTIQLTPAGRYAAEAKLSVIERCIPISIGLAGHFTLTVSGGKRGTVVLADFDNMILDAGLNYLAGGGSQASIYCQVGTGTAAVNAAQIALVNRIAGTAAATRNFGSSVYVAGPPAYKWDYKTYRFASGAAAGNLTEVGIGWTDNGNLFSRALIVDGGGTPTTVTVLSDETLDVTYTLRAYAPADATGTITLDGVVHNYTLRGGEMADGGGGTWQIGDLLTMGFASATVASVAVYSGGISATPGGTPSGTVAYAAAVCVPAAYVANSLQRSTEVRLDLNDCNIAGGIRSYRLIVNGNTTSGNQPTHAYQLEFSPNILKDATKKLRLNFTFSVARAP